MKDALIHLILKYGIIKTNFKQPITFKSGIKSPIYCNFRECSSYPQLMEMIADNFYKLMKNTKVDCIIGVATGAVPHSTVLAKKLSLPSGYIRPDAKAKDYGLKKLIEGCDVSEKNVVIIEDLITTGDSVINNAVIVKKAGAKNVEIKSIFSYDLDRSKKEFAEAGFTPESIITIYDVMPYLKEILSVNEYESLLDWVREPEGWFNRHKTEFEFGFLTQLRQSAQNAGSIICMGHDPVIEALPKDFQKHGIYGYVHFMNDVFMALIENNQRPGMFKPNLAWWVCHDRPFAGEYKGYNALVGLIQTMRLLFENVPITLDNKTGDIGTSSTKWAQYGLENWYADAVTVQPYMGSDSIGPFADYCNAEKKKGAYLLVKTTNKGASDLQLKKMADGQFVYEEVAKNVINWAAGKPGLGVVTAGNSPEDLSRLLKIFAGKDIPGLIPGVGPSQGGDAGQVAQIIRESGFEIELARINLSSAFFSWYKPGKENPSTNECVDMVVETMRSLNEKVGLIY